MALIGSLNPLLFISKPRSPTLHCGCSRLWSIINSFLLGTMARATYECVPFPCYLSSCSYLPDGPWGIQPGHHNTTDSSVAYYLVRAGRGGKPAGILGSLQLGTAGPGQGFLETPVFSTNPCEYVDRHGSGATGACCCCHCKSGTIWYFPSHIPFKSIVIGSKI